METKAIAVNAVLLGLMLIAPSRALAAAGDVHVNVSTYCGASTCVEVTQIYIENADGTLTIFETKYRTYDRYHRER